MFVSIRPNIPSHWVNTSLPTLHILHIIFNMMKQSEGFSIFLMFSEIESNQNQL